MTSRPDHLIVNFDFAGGCRGSCPSCTLSESERAHPVAFLNGHQLVAGLRAALERVPEPSFLAMGLGRGNVLSMDESAHLHIQDLMVYAKDRVPRAKRVLEISTSLIDAPRKQKNNALALMEASGNADPELELRFVVVLDASKTSLGYWSAVESFLKEMSAWRGSGDGSGDILTVNLSLSSLIPANELLSKIDYWRGPVNLQWLASGDSVYGVDEIVLAERWFRDFLIGAKLRNVDCSLLNVARAARDDYGQTLPEILENGLSRLAWVDKSGVCRHGVFTMLGDYAVWGGADASSSIRKMMRHDACRACPVLLNCIRAGGFAPASKNVELNLPSMACPSLLRASLVELSNE